MYQMIQDQKHWCEALILRVSNRSSVPKYQVLLFLNFGLKWIIAGMILFSLNFFYVTPEFVCSKGELPSGQTCEDYVCSLDERRWYQHLQAPVPKSIALDYGIIMLCSNKWLSSLLQSLSYIGSFVGYIIMSHVADNFGRKKAQSISWYLGIFGLILLVSSYNLFMVGVGSFFMGLGTNAAITLHYTFLKELLSGKLRERSFLLLQVMFSIGIAFVALSSWFIYDWKIVAGVFMLIPAVLMIPYSLWIIQETLMFSLKNGKQALLKSVNKMARINKQDELIIEDLQFIPDPHQTQKPQSKTKYTIIDLFRYKSLRYITIACGCIDLAVQFIYDGTILSLDKIGINVYLDQILVGFVEIFAALFCSWIIVKVARNLYLKICLVLVACLTCVIGILTFVFQHKNNEINFHVIMEMIILACLRFVLNSAWGLFYVYVAELYPTCVLSLAFGWTSTVGSIGAFSAPFIRLLTADATMFFMSGLCIACVFVVNGLRETKGEQTAQEIQEIQQENQVKRSVQSEKQNI